MCKCLLSRLLLNSFCLVILVSPSWAAALNDPTCPPGYKTYLPKAKKPVLKRWVLSSTLISNSSRSALINGKWRKPGSMIEGAKVVAIKPNRVWLIFNQKRISIKLLSKQVKNYSSLADK